jgi:hypothetical protein
VAGFELHVRLRIACRRLVREGRVAEVVPGAERLGDRSSPERRAHVRPRQLARVERGAEGRVAEHERVVGPVAARLPLLLEQAPRRRAVSVVACGQARRCDPIRLLVAAPFELEPLLL